VKPLDEQDHYEVLEVTPGAAFEDIERAYRLTRAAYTDGSMALYSIFNRDDAAVIRSRIDEAYRVLTDPQDRARYDAEAGIADRHAEAATPTATRPIDAFPLEVDCEESEARTLPAELPSAIEVIDDPDADIDEETSDFDGAALRRARLRRGVELDQISDVTKVSVKYLRCIEEEDFERLPASVYVRGFVTAYARAIGLDARRVSTSYMERVEAAREQPQRRLRSSSR
jgi:flagellar biosynthesis protein FlhG